MSIQTVGSEKRHADIQTHKRTRAITAKLDEEKKHTHTQVHPLMGTRLFVYATSQKHMLHTQHTSIPPEWFGCQNAIEFSNVHHHHHQYSALCSAQLGSNRIVSTQIFGIEIEKRLENIYQMMQYTHACVLVLCVCVCVPLTILASSKHLIQHLDFIKERETDRNTRRERGNEKGGTWQQKWMVRRVKK